jgi:hypothetical protein
MGMELELPIVILDDKGQNVTQKIAVIDWQPYFKVEGDASWRAGAVGKNTSPTNVEIVTEPIDEHLPGAYDVLGMQIKKIDAFIEVVEKLSKKQTEAVTVAALLPHLGGAKLGENVPPEARKWLVGVPTTGRNHNPPSANVHFTVGIRYESLVEAAAWVNENSIEAARGRITHDLSYKAVVGLADSLDEGFFQLSQGEQQEVVGFCYLVFSNAQAVAMAEVKDDVLAKNYAPMLSRPSFTSVFANLSTKSRKFVAAQGKALADNLAGQLAKSPTAELYLRDSFAGRAKAQTEYFHGMKMLGVEPVGPQDRRDKGVPVEIRALGEDSYRTRDQWVKLAFELLDTSRKWHGTSNVDVEHMMTKTTPALKSSATPLKPAAKSIAPTLVPTAKSVAPTQAPTLKPSLPKPMASQSIPTLSLGTELPPTPTFASPTPKVPTPQINTGPKTARPLPIPVVKTPAPLSSVQTPLPGTSVPQTTSSVLGPPKKASAIPLATAPVLKPAVKTSIPTTTAPKQPTPVFIPPSVNQISSIRGNLKPVAKGQLPFT